MKNQIEAPFYHFKIIKEGFALPAGEVYQAVESPRGEMGYYIVSDGTAKPYRVHMRSACFANLQTLATMCEGRLLADVVAAIGSLDIVLGGVCAIIRPGALRASQRFCMPRTRLASYPTRSLLRSQPGSI